MAGPSSCRPGRSASGPPGPGPGGAIAPAASPARMRTTGDAARDAVPIVVGYLTLGLAAGMLLVAQGLAWWWAPIWSLVIYSGTMQMLLVPLAAAGQPLAAIALSTCFVSGRHVFYGLGFPLDRLRGGALRRLYGIHAITDEVYALLAAKDRYAMSGRYLLSVEAISQASWVVGTTAGAAAGTGLAALLGERVELLGFVLTALFVVLAIENWTSRPDAAVVCVALVASAVGLAVGGSAVLLTALVVLALGLVGVFLLRSRREAGPAGAGRAADPRSAGGPGGCGDAGDSAESEESEEPATSKDSGGSGDDAC